MQAFEAWLEHLFDRPPSDLEPTPWYHRLDDPPTEWTLRYQDSDTPVAQAERIRRLFSDAGTLLRPYSDEQAGHGLNVIVSPAGGDIGVLTGGQIPPALRAAGLRSIVTLFAEVFAPRLRAAHPGYADPWQRSDGPGQPVHPLDFICYMFWDVAPLVPRGDATVLEVLEATLALDSVACQRAALHGLGHEYFSAPGKVPQIIHRWLQRHPDAPDELRAYAVQATTGRVQ